MCGFLTEFSFNNCVLSSRQNFEALLLLSKKRGPDSSLIYTNEKYQLGFNRLAILDLSKNGDQPIYSPSNRYHMVFNGEIYNYKGLENTYQLSNLKSTSDTEVLVNLLDKLGIERTLKELNGMFAIAIMDTKTNNCYLARDFAGIKPLFYGVCEKGLVAASQFDQVFNHLWFKESLQLRAEIMKEYFGFGYMQAPNTIYQNIFQVKPGEYIKVSKNGNIEIKTFQDFKFDAQTRSATMKELVNTIEDEINSSIKKQLVSDVPLATFLSGGIDSPLITAISKQHRSDIESFTVSVKDVEIDESEAASAYAKHINVNHQIQSFEENELLNCIDEHFRGFSEPFGDYSSIPTYLITKKASQNFTVMLSGDGGDELFFGYPRMLDVLKKQHWFLIPFKIRKPIIRIANKLKLTNTWAPYHNKTLRDWIKEKHTYIFKAKLDTFFPNTSFSNELNSLYNLNSKSSSTSVLKWLRYNEFYGHLQRILIKVDRMSMANSMEVRVPFLDKNMIKSALSYYPETFKKNKDLKKVLKEMMSHHFPESIIYKKKKGFSVPIEQWLRHQLQDDVKNVIFDKPFYGAQFMNVEAIKKYVDDFYDKKHDSAWGVWHIYAWQKWAISQDLI